MGQPFCGPLKARPFLKSLLRPIPLILVAMLVGRGSEAQTLSSLPSRSGAIVTKRNAVAQVPGWARFCRQWPKECAIDPSEPAKIALTPQVWETLVGINRQVNAAIKPLTDLEHWGVDDRWDFAEDGYGDCEDYQLLKRKRLVAAGVPRRALRMTAVIDENGAPHAVMMVRTDRGDFILDNKRSAVLPWRETGYVYLQREGDTGSAWVSLGRAVASPVATAGR
ncbi:transglutaminase-like cysteine peptidase [Microvirga sp. TS319]|uniref:transglutaminase-like cysteine peptidase n=1 Tax=Microvirga sp. TS319 TaxID=3241165 RepID=UPI00351A0518